jgi:hypothetical protein
MRLAVSALSLVAVVVAATLWRAQAAEVRPDAGALYDLRFEATPQLEQGAAGVVTVRIAPRKGAHLSDEAPLKLSLSAPELTFSKAKATRDDLRMDGTIGTLEVPFTAVAPGKTVIEAKLKFYICTEQTCAQQERAASLSVLVRGP